MKKTFVYATIVVEGYHNFPGATERPFKTGTWSDVSHLAERHMHYFYIKVWVEVKHEDRDIEFIQLRRTLQRCYQSQPIEFGEKSCEMIADDLYETIVRPLYSGREIRIDVSEDNINGALVEYAPD